MSRPSSRRSSSTRVACATISGPMPSPGNTAIFITASIGASRFAMVPSIIGRKDSRRLLGGPFGAVVLHRGCAVNAAVNFDEQALRQYLRRHLPATDGSMSIEPLQGGQSNPTFRVRFVDASYVLR